METESTQEIWRHQWSPNIFGTEICFGLFYFLKLVCDQQEDSESSQPANYNVVKKDES